jgi:tRNA threonylcarbamoyl adenosine modification protein YeaZ
VTILAISTSSPALSIALIAGDRVIARHHELIGRGHAEALVPAVQALLQGRVPEEVRIDVGPGSYTGIRIGIAAARALGLAWGVPVHGIGALQLVAAAAFAADPALPAVLALIDAGRGHAAGGTLGRDLAAPVPAIIAALPADAVVAGAGALLLGAAAARHGDHPDAAWAGLVPSAVLMPPTALYAGE